VPSRDELELAVPACRHGDCTARLQYDLEANLWRCPRNGQPGHAVNRTVSGEAIGFEHYTEPGVYLLDDPPEAA
jgi:hypothetical protein